MEASIKSLTGALPVLTGASNFLTWRTAMEAYFKAIRVLHVLDDGSALAEEKALPGNAEKSDAELQASVDNKANIGAFVLLTQVKEDLRHLISGKSFSEAWESITETFQPRTAASVFAIKRELQRFKFKPEEPAALGISRLEQLFSRLALADPDNAVSDSDKGITLLASLPTKYDNVARLLEITDSFDYPSVKRAVLAAFTSSSSSKPEDTSHNVALLSDNAPRCHRCKGFGHVVAVCPSPPLSEHKTPALGQDRQASAAHGSSTPASRHKPHDRKPFLKPKKVISMMARTQPGKRTIPLRCEHGHTSGGPNDIVFVIDSGATSHIASQASVFSYLSPLRHRTVVTPLGDVPLDGQATGTVELHVGDNCLSIQNVLLVPGANTNLLSVAKIVEAGLSTTFTQGCCAIMRGTEHLCCAVKEDGLYKLAGSVTQHGQPAKNPPAEDFVSALVADAKLRDEAQGLLWHSRTGHVGSAVLHQITKKAGYDIDLADEKVPFCQCCAIAKSTDKPHSKFSSNPASRPLAKLFADVTGPFRVRSLGGARYALHVVDGDSKFIFSKICAGRVEAADLLLNLILQELPRQFPQLPVATVVTDGAGEFTSKEFKDRLAKAGIEHVILTPYDHAANGQVERYHRSVQEMVRVMLFQSKLPHTLWAELFATAVYIRNRLPSHALGGQSPFSRLYGRTPQLSHLRVIGSTAYAHIPAERQGSKLAPRTKIGFLVGYKGSSYRLYDPLTHQVSVARAVVFDETKSVAAAPVGAVAADVNKSEVLWEFELDKLVPDALPEAKIVEPGAPQTAEAVVAPQAAEAVGAPQAAAAVGAEHLNQDAPAPAPVAPQAPRVSERLRSHYRPSESYLQHLSQNLARVGGSKREFAYSVGTEPGPDSPSLEEALSDPNWLAAMRSELDNIEARSVWEPAILPPGATAIPTRWVHRRKANGKHKSRLVAQGFRQVPGRDYTASFAPVARASSIRLVLAIAAQQGWQVRQVDVRAAYLYAPLEESIYVAPPPGFPTSDGRVYRLRRALYGLKQAGRAWYNTITDFLFSLGFVASDADPCVFLLRAKDRPAVIIVLYVDDCVITGARASDINEFERRFSSKFEVSALSDVDLFVGIQVVRLPTGIAINQSSYIRQVLTRFGMENASPSPTPMGAPPTPDGDAFDHSKYAEAVGCLMWIAQSSRPDISYAVSALAQAQSSPTTGHWTGVKRVMRYLSSTADLNIHYEQSSSSPHLTGWADADHAGDVTDRKSRTGYVFMVAGGTVAWRSKKQQSVALSTAESELIALSLAAQECIHLRRLLSDIGFAQDDPTLLNGDNEAAIRIATNDAGASSRLKHVAVRHFFVREACNQGAISIIHVPSASNIADVMTKSLPRDPFLMFRRTLGLK